MCSPQHLSNRPIRCPDDQAYITACSAQTIEWRIILQDELVIFCFNVFGNERFFLVADLKPDVILFAEILPCLKIN